jgi:hypothetical protein
MNSPVTLSWGWLGIVRGRDIIGEFCHLFDAMSLKIKLLKVFREKHQVAEHQWWDSER